MHLNRGAGLDQRQLDFGPFDPRGQLFESEFHAPTPRPVPQKLHRGSYAIIRKRLHLGLLLGGIICLILSPARAISSMGAYFVPFAYLHRIGLGLLVIMLGAFIHFRFGGSFRYIRKGIPVAARILDISGGTYQDGTLGFACLVECLPPGETESVTVICSSPGRQYSERHCYQLSVKPGDYVTGVYLPGQFPKSLRLYGFLGLNPDVTFVSKAPKTSFKKNPVLHWLIILTWAALLAGVYALWYVLSHCEPLHWGWNIALPGIIGGLMIAAWYAFLSVWETREDVQRFAAQDEAAAAGENHGPSGQKSLWLDSSLKAWGFKIALGLSSMAFGAALTLSALCLTNARLDRSKPYYRPVVIQRMMVTTHNSIFKTYSIEYSWVGSKKTRTIQTSLAHIQKFNTDVGFAEIHEGRLGWPWLETIHPGVMDPMGRVRLDD